MTQERKVMHINLYGDHVEDYSLVRTNTGITNDNDLVRFLFRQAANQIRRQGTLVDAPVEYATEAVGGE